MGKTKIRRKLNTCYMKNPITIFAFALLFAFAGCKDDDDCQLSEPTVNERLVGDWIMVDNYTFHYAFDPVFMYAWQSSITGNLMQEHYVYTVKADTIYFSNIWSNADMKWHYEFSENYDTLDIFQVSIPSFGFRITKRHQ